MDFMSLQATVTAVVLSICGAQKPENMKLGRFGGTQTRFLLLPFLPMGGGLSPVPLTMTLGSGIRRPAWVQPPLGASKDILALSLRLSLTPMENGLLRVPGIEPFVFGILRLVN